MKKALTIGFAFGSALLLLISVVEKLRPRVQPARKQGQSKKIVMESVASSAENYYLPKPRLITGTAANISEIEISHDLSPSEIASRYLEEHREEFRVQRFHSLRPVEADAPMGKHIKYQVYQDDLPVLGLDISVYVGQDGSILNVNNNYRPIQEASLNGIQTLSADEILRQSAGRFSSAADGREPSSMVLYVAPGRNDAEPAFSLRVFEQGQTMPVQVIFRATDGQVLGRSVPRTER